MPSRFSTRALAALLTALWFAAPALALNLQPYTLQTTGAVSGGLPGALPNATVTIQLFGTTTKATIYPFSAGTCSGTSMANPMTSDVNGLASFCADAGSVYQAVWSLGAYTSPTVYFPTNLGALLSANNAWTGTNTFSGTVSYLGGVTWTGLLSNSTVGGGTLMSLGAPGGGAHSSSTPDAIDLGNDYSGTSGSNPKLIVYHDNSSQAGLGYSIGGFDFISSASAGYNFWANGSNVFQISGSSLSTGTVNVNFTTASTNSSNGALVVTGGAGIGGAVNVTGAIAGGGAIQAATAFQSTGHAPTVSSCGTSPSAFGASTNNGGGFTTGTGAPTSCTVTLANAFPNNGFCVVVPTSSYTGTLYVSHIGGDSTGKTGFVLNLSAGAASTTFNYTCWGN